MWSQVLNLSDRRSDMENILLISLCKCLLNPDASSDFSSPRYATEHDNTRASSMALEKELALRVYSIIADE